MVKIVGGDREKLNELQTDVNRYILAEEIWRSRNEERRNWFLYEGVLISP